MFLLCPIPMSGKIIYKENYGKYIATKAFKCFFDEVLYKMTELERRSYLVNEVINHFGNHDFLECSRKLGIQKAEFYNELIPKVDLAERFIERVYELEKENELDNYLITKNTGLSTSNRSAESFGKLLNAILEEFDKTDKSEDFKECDLFKPIEFEEKMRKKAQLSEDLIEAGIRIKPDIVVLRKKARALNYSNYEKLIQKLARFYKHSICVNYPVGTVSSSERFSRLYNAIENIIPERLYHEVEDIETNIEGLIYETISQCLIFNE